MYILLFFKLCFAVLYNCQYYSYTCFEKFCYHVLYIPNLGSIHVYCEAYWTRLEKLVWKPDEN